MNRNSLIDEVWREEVRDEIVTCIIMREGKPLEPACNQCDYHPICKLVIEYEKEETDGE